MKKGQIVQSLSGYYDVQANGTIFRTRARGNFRNKKTSPLVGDWVEFKADNEKEGYLLKILKRKNRLVRPPVVNVDCGIVVTACKEPQFSANLLDRQLLMLENNNISPFIYFSKADLLSKEERPDFLSLVNSYQKLYSSYIADKDDPGGIRTDFLGKIHSKVIVVMGQTGAGKSTFLNLVDPSLKLETAQISKALSRGKHTTRKVTLRKIQDNLIADTPGFSSFEIMNVTKEELPLLYPEFLQLCDKCKYRGCLHLKEPGCAVKDAYQNGDLLASRYENYVLFQDEIAKRKPKY